MSEVLATSRGASTSAALFFEVSWVYCCKSSTLCDALSLVPASLAVKSDSSTPNDAQLALIRQTCYDDNALIETTLGQFVR
jgi:hypothetical protein